MKVWVAARSQRSRAWQSHEAHAVGCGDLNGREHWGASVTDSDECATRLGDGCAVRVMHCCSLRAGPNGGMSDWTKGEMA